MVDPCYRQLALDEARPRGPMTDNIEGGKGSVFYRAHSYHTKVPVEGLIQLIEHYTDPGDVVLDPFCGSGQTGVAAVLTGRRAVLSDLSPAAVHIASGYTARVDPDRFKQVTSELLVTLKPLETDLYGVPGGRIEYTVWSDVYRCPACEREVLFWDAAVDHEAGGRPEEAVVPRGPWALQEDGSPLAAFPAGAREHQPRRSSISTREAGRGCETGGTESNGPVSRTGTRAFPGKHGARCGEPSTRFKGSSPSADFFTARNLYALSALWNAIGQVEEDSIRAGLRFVFTASVNRASRRYQWHPRRPTNVLSSTMYLASLNYEFNVFSLFRRKLATITDMYRQTWDAPGSCEVHLGSAEQLAWVADGSIDYVFTDPPFGSNIYYSDSSFLWEAWLGEQTDVAAETVVNRRLTAELGRTTLDDYEKAMSRAMGEVSRVMRPGAWASLQFHNSDDAVWSSIQNAVDLAGLRVEAAVVMDKGAGVIQGTPTRGQG